MRVIRAKDFYHMAGFQPPRVMCHWHMIDSVEEGQPEWIVLDFTGFPEWERRSVGERIHKSLHVRASRLRLKAKVEFSAPWKELFFCFLPK